MKIFNLFFIIIFCIMFLIGNVCADDVDVVLDSDGADSTFTVKNNSLTDLMTVTADGKVGLGTSNFTNAHSGTDLMLVDSGTDSFTALQLIGYNDQIDYYPFTLIGKSHTDAEDMLISTVNGEYLGAIYFQGVDSGNHRDSGAVIKAIQNGPVGARVPTDFIVETFDDTAINSNQLVLHHDGGVGIGIAYPRVNLDIRDYSDNTQLWVSSYSETLTDRPYLVFRRSHTTGTTNVTTVNGESIGLIQFRGVDSGNRSDEGAQIRITQNGTAGDFVPCDMFIETFSSTENNSNQLVLHHDGNVGIGIMTPARTLHVNQCMRLEPTSTAPSSPSAGDFYFDSTDNKLKCFDGSTWQSCW